MRLARFVPLLTLVDCSTTAPTKDEAFALRYIEAYRQCYNEVSAAGKTVSFLSSREPLSSAEFQAVKDCANKYLQK